MKFSTPSIIFLLVAPLVVSAGSNTFSRNLSLGMSGEDVHVLQILLNTDVSTRIAETGPGSKGNETYYFGGATKRAVIKLQEKYRSEVLTPVGLSFGNGFIGLKTRAKLEFLLAAMNTKVPDILPVPIQPPAPPETQETFPGIVVKSPSQYYGKPGTLITLSGWGFTATDNTVLFGDVQKVENLKSTDGFTLSLAVPQIPRGVYTVSVKNGSGESQTKTFFAVTDGIAPLPTIESITPLHATRGDTVTIKGTGFAPAGNMLRTTLGVFSNIASSDTTTLSFVVPRDMYISASSTPLDQKVSLPLWVYVVNENGVSAGKSFTGDF